MQNKDQTTNFSVKEQQHIHIEKKSVNKEPELAIIYSNSSKELMITSTNSSFFKNKKEKKALENFPSIENKTHWPYFGCLSNANTCEKILDFKDKEDDLHSGNFTSFGGMLDQEPFENRHRYYLSESVNLVKGKRNFSHNNQELTR